MKRILSLTLALVMVLGTFTGVFAAEAEVNPAEFLKEVGVLEGDDGDLMLDRTLLRRDMVILLSRLMGVEDVAVEFPGAEEILTFEDITDAYYNGYLAWSVSNKLIEGHDEKTFGFNENVTAQDYATVLLRALNYEVDDAEWAKALETAKELGILKDVEVENKTEITREQMAVMTYNALSVTIKDQDITLAGKLGIELPKPLELKVDNVTADNLKQVEVEFNQKLDKSSAENKDNYSVGLDIEMVELQEDERTVVLTLDASEDVKFEMQKEYTLKINNVENYAKDQKLNNFSDKFRPVDVTVPTVKEVVGLGTKAIKVVFSEPVKRSPANSTTSYKIDDKFVAGSAKYVFPNEVIISTNLSVGEHTLSVSGVKDFNDYTVQEPGVTFTIAEDTEAPEIVSAYSVDLDKVIVEFNEPVKSLTRAYHSSTSNLAKAPITINGNKVILEFNNKMSLGETTIYLDNVEDYSGNKANRNITITPELDMSRPEVVEVKVKDGIDFTVTFNKSVDATEAKKAANYILKKGDGSIVKGNGLNVNGNPVRGIELTDNNKKAKFSLVKPLAEGSYILEIAGIRDNATIQNIMLPYSYSFEIGDLVAPTISRVWVSHGEIKDGKKNAEIYIQYSEAMAIDGNGSVLDVVKYNYFEAEGSALKVMPKDTKVELLTNDTVKLVLPAVEGGYTIAGIRVALVSDLSENFIKDLMVTIEVLDSAKIEVDTVEAVEKDVIEVTFKGRVEYIDENDFVLSNGTTMTYENIRYEKGKTIVEFRLSKDLPANVGVVKLSTVAQNKINSQDQFGNAVKEFDVLVEDAIAPTIESIKTGENLVLVTFDENIKAEYVSGVVTVKVNGESNSATEFYANGKQLAIVTDFGELKVDEDLVEVTLLDANNSVKAITDLKDNAPEAFVEYVLADNRAEAPATPEEAALEAAEKALEEATTALEEATAAKEEAEAEEAATTAKVEAATTAKVEAAEAVEEATTAKEEAEAALEAATNAKNLADAQVLVAEANLEKAEEAEKEAAATALAEAEEAAEAAATALAEAEEAAEAAATTLAEAEEVLEAATTALAEAEAALEAATTALAEAAEAVEAATTAKEEAEAALEALQG